MVPNAKINERVAIRDSLISMLEAEEKTTFKIEKVRSGLREFVYKNAAEFKSKEDRRNAKDIIGSIFDNDSDADVINKIAEISKLLKDSSKFADELEAIIAIL